MALKLTRRDLVATTTATAVTLALGPRAWAAAAPLPEAARRLGGSAAAWGPSPKALRLAVLSFQGSSFWEAVGQGIAAATAYLAPLGSTVDPIPLGTALTPGVVVAGIDAALARQDDGIAVVPILDGSVAKVNEAVAAGVPVIAFIADPAERSKRTVGMGILPYKTGRKVGTFIAKQLGGSGKIAIFTGNLGAARHNDRMDGALDLLKQRHPRIKVLGPFDCKGDDAVAYAQAMEVMTENLDLDVIYVTAGGSEAAAKAIRDAEVTGKVGVVGYDNLPEKQTYLDGGEILALIDQAPARQAFDSLVMLHNILGFGTRYPSSIVIDAPIVYGRLAKA